MILDHFICNLRNVLPVPKELRSMVIVVVRDAGIYEFSILRLTN
jgi:hypothetical protein